MKTIAIVFVLSLVEVFLSAPGGALLAQDGNAPFKRGDADGDGVLNITDGVKILNVIFRGESVGCVDAMDTNDSGSVELTDAVRVFLRLFSGGGPFPPPRECGRDPTDDDLDCQIYRTCGPQTETRDLSSFTSFRYQQLPGLGFCPEMGTPVDLEIVRGEESWRLSCTRIVEGNPETDVCVPEAFEVPCATLVEDPPREMTAQEVERIASAFAEVEVTQGRDPICDDVVFDPCLVQDLTWDDVRVTDFTCAELRLTFQEGRRILRVLETLKADGR